MPRLVTYGGQSKIADQDPQDPEKFNSYMHYKI